MTSPSKKLHLQGLRTIAIVSVVLFHFFPKHFPNGYLGVDQFFLLSGYLMTMMLGRSPTISVIFVLDFFYKRVKRIVPLYYLVSLAIISISFTLPPASLRVNFDSAIKSLFFATNLIRPTGLDDYAERLGLGVDMLTHTWSLSVEMQYYLLVPIIFLVAKTLGSLRNVFILLLAAASFYFHATTNSFLSFYCVGFRIWQFLAGMLIFYDSRNEVESNSALPDKERLLEEAEQEPEETKKSQLVTNVCLVGVVALSSSRIEVPSLIGRFFIILLTSLIVHGGERNTFLENRIMVFIGEISYSWYLVHWPIVALLKMNKHTSNEDMIYGVAVSFLITLILHFAFEKQYLTWTRSTIVKLTLLLVMLNGAALWKLGERAPHESIVLSLHTNASSSSFHNRFIYESDTMNVILLGYENKTAEERAKMNSQFDADDQKQINDWPCTELATQPGFPRLCRMETNSTDTTVNKTLLIVGNSYAGNVGQLIYDECKETFNQIIITWTTCEVLAHSMVNHCDQDYYLDAIKTFAPDVLFIIQRHLDGMNIVNGTNPFNDDQFKTMVNRLEVIEKHVKSRMYILDALPTPFNGITDVLNKYLRFNISFSEDSLIDRSRKFEITKDRLRRLELGCDKCHIYDYEPLFYIDGKYRLFDPEYFLSFYSIGLHLTPVSLERIRPLYKQMCYDLKQ